MQTVGWKELPRYSPEKYPTETHQEWDQFMSTVHISAGGFMSSLLKVLLPLLSEILFIFSLDCKPQGSIAVHC